MQPLPLSFFVPLVVMVVLVQLAQQVGVEVVVEARVQAPDRALAWVDLALVPTLPQAPAAMAVAAVQPSLCAHVLERLVPALLDTLTMMTARHCAGGWFAPCTPRYPEPSA